MSKQGNCRPRRGLRAVALVLSVALASLGLFTGCKDKNHGLKKDSPVSISIWHYYNGAQKQMFDEMVTEFNESVGAEKGIVVQAYSQGSVNDLTAKVMDAIDKKVGAEEVPDVFAAYADTAYEINRRGMAADLSQYLTKEERDSYVSAYLDEGAFSEEGSIKLFPTAKSTEVLTLNKTDWDKFAAATGASEEDLRSWEGICKLAKSYYEWTDSLTPEKNDGKAFFGRDVMANYFIIGSMQLGQELFSVENGQVTYNLDKAVMRRLWDNYYTPYVSGYFTSIGRFRSDDAKTGDIIALVGSTSGNTYFPTAVTLSDGSSYPIDAKTYALPNFEGTKPYAVQQGAGMMVTKSDETREYAATLFLKWFTEKQQNVRFAIGSGYLPVKKDANTAEAIGGAVATSPEPISELMEETLLTGVEITQNYTLYTNEAFENGTEARAVVEKSLQQKAVADREAVKALLDGGSTLADAVAQYDTDENFESWYQDFSAQLAAL
ncbi:extracellular solute-binding protein [bacterium 210820-DFI.6.52]|nr:extracellular solute-binding protein [bacterium 210820-DFI.6.52]